MGESVSLEGNVRPIRPVHPLSMTDAPFEHDGPIRPLGWGHPYNTMTGSRKGTGAPVVHDGRTR